MCRNSGRCRHIQEADALEARELASQLVDTLTDHFAEDILVLDIADLTTFADAFVIASAGSDRQLRALVEALQAVPKPDGRSPRLEGEAESGWVLVDHGSVITHLFSRDKRKFYDLEGLWRSARVVVRVQ